MPIPDSPILHQNKDRSITLIDIPASIAHAQGIQAQILSCTARDEPFPSTEPKTPKARAKILALQEQAGHDAEYADLVQSALGDIHREHPGPWSLPRWLGDEVSCDEKVSKTAEDRMAKYLEIIAGSRNALIGGAQVKVMGDELDGLTGWDGSYYNHSGKPTQLQIASNSIEHKHEDEQGCHEAISYHIPSEASFLLADCTSPDRFRNHIRWLSQEYNKPRKFDFILLDPPWENRSAKRRAAYKTSSVQTMIEDMDLSVYLQPNGLVGIWVTNKAAHRELVLGEGGIFESLNVSLVEEWIWIKTTTKGEPVTQIDGLWRKPYEVLLLGRAPASSLEIAQPADYVVRRVIAGVPDFHSRKPCLKTLIEPYLPLNHQVLEVFARYLVQGWTSWGNEVLKYNWEGYHRETSTTT